jgi:hypothetical protein
MYVFTSWSVAHGVYNLRADEIGGAPLRVIGKMSVSLRRFRLGMAEEFADDLQAQVGLDAYGCMRVSQVMNSYPHVRIVSTGVEPGSLPDVLPRALQIRSGSMLDLSVFKHLRLARYHVWP